jgi:hypothetical protein
MNQIAQQMSDAEVLAWLARVKEDLEFLRIAFNAERADWDRKELVLQSGWVINYIAQQEALAAFQQEE